jgi:hypothetical protein
MEFDRKGFMHWHILRNGSKVAFLVKRFLNAIFFELLYMKNRFTPTNMKYFKLKTPKSVSSGVRFSPSNMHTKKNNIKVMFSTIKKAYKS